jgi:hypothetical protein
VGYSAHLLEIVPPNYYSHTQNIPLTNARRWPRPGPGPSFHNQVGGYPHPNVCPSYEPSSGPIRAEPVRLVRSRPYGMPYARANEHVRTRQGPLAPVPSSTPYVEAPTSQFPGLTPETTADAVKDQVVKEEQEVLVSGFYHSHIPRLTK